MATRRPRDCPGFNCGCIWELDAGPYRSFGDGGNLQSALRLPVVAKKVDWPLSVQPKAVSKLILSSGVMYNVVPTDWLLS